MNKKEYERLICCIAGHQIRFLVTIGCQEIIISPAIGVDNAENLLAGLKQSKFKFELRKKKNE